MRECKNRHFYASFGPSVRIRWLVFTCVQFSNHVIYEVFPSVFFSTGVVVVVVRVAVVFSFALALFSNILLKFYVEISMHKSGERYETCNNNSNGKKSIRQNSSHRIKGLRC